MKRGDKGKAVAEAQHAGAKFWGWSNGTWTPIAGTSDLDRGQPFRPGEDGDFGATTETNTKALQKRQGLPQTGVIDGVTAAILFAPYGGGATAAPDLSKLATKAELAAHAKAKASGTVHPHIHDEGATGGPQ